MIKDILNHMEAVWEEFWAEISPNRKEYIIFCTNQGTIVFANQEELTYYKTETNVIELMQFLANNDLNVICMQEDYWKVLEKSYAVIPVDFDWDGSWKINIPTIEDEIEENIDDRVDVYEDFYYLGD